MGPILAFDVSARYRKVDLGFARIGLSLSAETMSEKLNVYERYFQPLR